jgi:hypothetical protein
MTGLRFAKPDKNCRLMFPLGFGDAPQKEGDDWVFAHFGTVMVAAGRPHAVFTNGEMVASGLSMSVVATAGDRVSVKRIVPPRNDYSKDEIRKARQKTTVRVVRQQIHDSGPFNFGATYHDGTLDKVMTSLAKIRQSIPAVYRKTARCAIDSESGYEGSHYASISVTYERPETDAEVVSRLQGESIDREVKAAEKRKAYAALKAEMEG